MLAGGRSALPTRYFNNPKEPGVTENLSDQWFEGYVKPALSGLFKLRSSSEILRQGQRRR